MTTEARILTIQLTPEQAALIENVARLRAGNTNSQAPVDLGVYIFTLLNRDIAACLEEIKARRGA